MNAVLVILSIYASILQPPPIDGRATYYNPRKIEGAAMYHGISLQGADYFVALNDCKYIGDLVWVEHDMELTSCRVVDCAQRGEHYAKRERQGYVLDVQYSLAEHWGIVGVGPADNVRVHFTYPVTRIQN